MDHLRSFSLIYFLLLKLLLMLARRRSVVGFCPLWEGATCWFSVWLGLNHLTNNLTSAAKSNLRKKGLKEVSAQFLLFPTKLWKGTAKKTTLVSVFTFLCC